MLKSSSFLPEFSAAASHRGFRPRPAQVSLGFSGLQYFGATAPLGPPRPPLARDPSVARRSSLPSWACIAWRSSTTLMLRAASTCSLSFDNLSIDIDLRFVGVFMGVHCCCWAGSVRLLEDQLNCAVDLGVCSDHKSTSNSLAQHLLMGGRGMSNRHSETLPTAFPCLCQLGPEYVYCHLRVFRSCDIANLKLYIHSWNITIE
jgi:hypothetical protein